MGKSKDERIKELLSDRLFLAHFISGITPDRYTQTEAEADAVKDEVRQVVKRAQQEANDQRLKPST